MSENCFTGNGKYWADSTGQSTQQDSYCHYCHPSTEVEMTAYGLLANIYDGASFSEVLPFLSWLTRQQNKNGGFRSTQVKII